MTADYRRTISPAGKGDVVYRDPPYEPMPGTTGFTAYAAGGFSWENQWTGEAMRICLSPWARVVISNSSAPKVLDLYREHGFNLQFIKARRSISAKAVRGKSQKTLSRSFKGLNEPTLPFPPSVNSYWRAPSKGPLKGRHLVSETGRKFQQAARAAIIEQQGRSPAIL